MKAFLSWTHFLICRSRFDLRLRTIFFNLLTSFIDLYLVLRIFILDILTKTAVSCFYLRRLINADLRFLFKVIAILFSRKAIKWPVERILKRNPIFICHDNHILAFYDIRPLFLWTDFGCLFLLGFWDWRESSFEFFREGYFDIFKGVILYAIN